VLELDFAGMFRCITDHEQTRSVEIQGKRIPHDPLTFGSLTHPVRVELVRKVTFIREVVIARPLALKHSGSSTMLGRYPIDTS
jgi:hypothetical protein